MVVWYAPTMIPISLLDSAGWPLAYWVMIVVLVTLFGYPAVALLTPLAWLLALWVGRRHVLNSDDPHGRSALVGAASAGALFGLLLGVVLGVASLLLGDVTPEGEEGLRILTLLVTVIGVPVCALLAVGMGLFARRRTIAQKPKRQRRGRI